jgi:hypothetical protein
MRKVHSIDPHWSIVASKFRRDLSLRATLAAGSAFTVLTVLVLAFSCGSNSGGKSVASLACQQSLDDYCAHALPKCPFHLDPPDLAASFCDQEAAQVGNPFSFGLETCADGSLGVVMGMGGTPGDNELIYLYDGMTLDLKAILVETGVLTAMPSATCMAGPPILRGSGPCLDDLVFHGCGFDDAGAGDAASDGQ